MYEMSILNQIKSYINQQPKQKREDLEALHGHILRLMPKCKLWFFNGCDEKGKVVANPNIGYGQQTLKYAGGKTKAFYQIGISGNTAGITVYLLGFKDKNHMPDLYGKEIGKAKVTGYCIKFKSLKDIDIETLDKAILDAAGQSTER